MATITESDLGGEYWATSRDVRDEFQLEVGNRDPDFERRITAATRRVQAWYHDAAGKSPPADPPALLRDATALLAASLAHQAFSQNISGDNERDERHVFLEDAARDTFDDWLKQADLEPGADTADPGDITRGRSGVIGGTTDSPIHRGGG
jgi:hypothetical protein